MSKLCILIPHLNEPFYNRGLSRLLSILDPQIRKHSDKVSKLINDKGRSMTTGEKRNDLIRDSDSEYFSMIDSDDRVSKDYVERLLEGIEQGPDVITFCGKMITNGSKIENFVIKKDEAYETRDGVYYRYPNHLCCFRRSVVDVVKFPNLTKGEDYAWATEIRYRKLLKTEAHFNKDLYFYDYYEPRLRR